MDSLVATCLHPCRSTCALSSLCPSTTTGGLALLLPYPSQASPEESPSARNCAWCVAFALGPVMKDIDMKGDEDSVTRMENSWLRSSMSHTSRLPLLSVRYTTAGRVGLQQPVRAGRGRQRRGRPGQQGSQQRPPYPGSLFDDLPAWYPPLPAWYPACMLPPVHTPGPAALPLAPLLAKLKQMFPRQGWVAQDGTGCSLSAPFTSQPSPAVSRSVITSYLIPYLPPPATHPWCSSPRHSPTGTVVWPRPRARSGSSSPRQTAGCRQRRGSAPGRQWGRRVPSQGGRQGVRREDSKDGISLL